MTYCPANLILEGKANPELLPCTQSECPMFKLCELAEKKEVEENDTNCN